MEDMKKNAESGEWDFQNDGQYPTSQSCTCIAAGKKMTDACFSSSLLPPCCLLGQSNLSPLMAKKKAPITKISAKAAKKVKAEEKVQLEGRKKSSKSKDTADDDEDLQSILEGTLKSVCHFVLVLICNP